MVRPRSVGGIAFGTPLRIRHSGHAYRWRPPPPWGHDLWRMDAALAYRFTARTQLKLQYSLPHEDSGPRNIGHTIALQFTLRYSIVSPKLLSGFENLGAARKVTIPLR